MSMYNKIWSLPDQQKKLAVQKKLNELLAGKVVSRVSLDPHPETFAPFMHIECGDGTTITVATESDTGLDGGPYDVLAIRVNGQVIASL